MDRDDNRFHRHVFLVRVWRERQERRNASDNWKGRIEHVPSNAYSYFTSLDKVADFISHHSGMPSTGDDIRWRWYWPLAGVARWWSGRHDRREGRADGSQNGDWC